MNENNPMDGMSDESIQYAYETLMAYVDTIIPRTPLLAQEYGNYMLYGALDLYIDEYLYMIQDIYPPSTAFLTARMLNAAAEEYLASKNGQVPRENVAMQESVFATLSMEDRYRVLALIMDIKKNFPKVLFFNENPALILIAGSLNRFTMLGYYSEWFGYGTTRLAKPSERIFEFDPVSWEQAGYPGPSQSNLDYVRAYYQIRDSINGQ